METRKHECVLGREENKTSIQFTPSCGLSLGLMCFILMVDINSAQESAQDRVGLCDSRVSGVSFRARRTVQLQSFLVHLKGSAA